MAATRRRWEWTDSRKKTNPDKHWDGVGCVCTYCARCTRWWAFKGPAKDFWKLFIVCASGCVCVSAGPSKFHHQQAAIFVLFVFGFLFGVVAPFIVRLFPCQRIPSVHPHLSKKLFFLIWKKRKMYKAQHFGCFSFLAPLRCCQKVDDEIMWVKCDVIWNHFDWLGPFFLVVVVVEFAFVFRSC